MRSNRYPIYPLLMISYFSIVSSNFLAVPPFQVQYNVIGFVGSLGYFNDNLYYFAEDPSWIYNPFSKSISYSKLNPGYQDQQLIISKSFEIWSVGLEKEDDEDYYHIHLDLISDNQTLILKSFEAPNYIENESMFTSYISGNYIVLADEDSKMVSIFDTVSAQFLCEDTEITRGIPSNDVFFDGHAFLYMSDDYLVFLPCEAKYPISVKSNISKLEEERVLPFNQSSAFLNIFYGNDSLTTLQAFMYDITGVIRTGPVYNFSQVKTMNDTYFATMNASKGEIEFGLYSINHNLELALVNKFSSALPASLIKNVSITAIAGYYKLFVILDSDARIGFSYDFTLNEISEVYGLTMGFPPLVFEDSTEVNITYFGYLIKTPNEKTRIVYLDFNTSYQSPSDPTQVFLYTQYSKYNCSLLEFHGSSSSIQSSVFMSCPDLDYFKILDIAIDEYGNYIITFSDNSEENDGIYLLSSNGVQGPIKLEAALGGIVLITIFPINGTGVFVAEAEKKMLELAIYNLTDGSTLSSSSYKNSGAFAVKIYEQFYMFLSSDGSRTNFTVLDMTSFGKVCSFYSTLNFTGLSPNLDYVILGVNNSLVCNFNAIVVKTHGGLYLLDTYGYSTDMKPYFPNNTEVFLQPRSIDTFYFIAKNETLKYVNYTVYEVPIRPTL